MTSEREDGWKLVTEYPLERYDCGLTAGQVIRLLQDLNITNDKGRVTGKRFSSGTLWIVLRGQSDEPNTIWLRDPNGDRCTWDHTVFDYFELVE